MYCHYSGAQFNQMYSNRVACSVRILRKTRKIEEEKHTLIVHDIQIRPLQGRGHRLQEREREERQLEISHTGPYS